MLKNRFLSAAALVMAMSMMPGCATNRATATLTPGTDLSKVKSIYVVKLPQDNHNLDQILKTKLTAKGYTATTGTNEKPDTKVDAILTYVDKWMWDLSMYMIELTVTLRNPDSGFPMAVGNSYHTSLTRKSTDEMTDEVLNNIFSAPKQ